MNTKTNEIKKQEEPTDIKKKLPFWIKKKYIQNRPKPESHETTEKPRKKRSLFRNSPFRDMDRGLID